jgi:lysylphosphatidylglycerol synthetase-like protein (DUF2156 family)
MTDQQYGFTPGPPAGAPQMQQTQGNGMAVAALVMGILAVVLCFIPFLSWILGLLGVIFGAVGMSKANKIGGKGKGLAITGLILGVLGLIIGVAIFIWAIQQAKKEMRRSWDRYGEVMPAPQHDASVLPDRA